MFRIRGSHTVAVPFGGLSEAQGLSEISEFRSAFEAFSNGSYIWRADGPDSAIAYYTQGQLDNIISNAQALFSSYCDAKFSTVVPSYSNAGFFASLHATTFIQYPPGVPNPLGLTSTTADTEVYEPGRPIRLFPDFYPGNGVVLPAGFQEFVLVHEQLHRFTGWGDYPNQNTLAINGNDFETKFFALGYKNQTADTGQFTDWLQSSCPN